MMHMCRRLCEKGSRHNSIIKLGWFEMKLIFLNCVFADSCFLTWATTPPATTMDAIKKKMQAMKLEKDTAQDKADTCEMQAREANLRADKVKN